MKSYLRESMTYYIIKKIFQKEQIVKEEAVFS